MRLSHDVILRHTYSKGLSHGFISLSNIQRRNTDPVFVSLLCCRAALIRVKEEPNHWPVHVVCVCGIRVHHIEIHVTGRGGHLAERREPARKGRDVLRRCDSRQEDRDTEDTAERERECECLHLAESVSVIWKERTIDETTREA